MLRILDARAVRELLSVSELAAEIGAAFTAGGDGATEFARSSVRTDAGELLLMPAVHSNTLSVKLISLFDNPPELRLPSVQGLVTLFDAATGRPVAVLDATAVTELRTAAVTVCATDLLARPDARVLTVIGAGVQGRGHLEGLAGIRPWDSVRLHSRDPRRARKLAAWARERGLAVEVLESVDAAVRDADVICTVTTSPEPLFEDSAVAREGVHLSAVGAYGATRRELPSRLVARSSLFVESAAAVLREAGDILIPIAEGALPADPPMSTLGEVLAGRRPGRRSPGETTLFKSVGVPIEDAFTCDLLYRLAVARNAGQSIPFE
ncbi:ornithine cyclodeaminase family protein [Streptomyces sp. SAJ15]|uniref:ornithine cyclodeaminase family protein n=1 Tax=Streptomyces sp. SAJ15 TaxID=2011095 RepID=UPI0011862AE9|nr:ornithine cyclodeaminase family protein [Streptomyces sp. SAJ15]TVL91489.1 ornithine cyclodeaminase [Streptomyces sp. SAJ15]